MNIVQLEYFVMVAQEGNLTRAATKLNLSQPTLSASISRIEEELDTRLFDRVGRQIVLNDDGKFFYEHANIILNDYNAMLTGLEKRRNLNSNSIRISFNTYDSQNDIILKFSQQHPDIYIHQRMETVESDGVLRFPDGSDFYISNNACTGKNLDEIILGSDEILVILSCTHPLASKKSLTFSDLIDERFVTNHEGSGFNLFLNSLFEDYGYSVPYKVYAMPPNWKHYVEKNYIALVTGNYVRAGNFPSSFVFIPFLDDCGSPIFRQLRLYWKNDIDLSSSAMLFLEYVMKEK